MLVKQQPAVSVEDFESFVQQPENADRLFEYIEGEVVEVVSNPLSSKVAAIILGLLFQYLQKNDIGHLTGADGGYVVAGQRYIPDVGFIRYEKQPELGYDYGYIPVPPDLAVEVVSPANEMQQSQTTLKTANYLAEGTVVWLVRPAVGLVHVLRPGEPAQTLTLEDTLDGGDILPGFSVKVADVFPKPRQQDQSQD